MTITIYYDIIIIIDSKERFGLYNIYCDESCHLQNDGNDIMVLGGISCPTKHAKETNLKIRQIKESYGLGKNKYGSEMELKWTKVSKNKMGMYKELIDLFFELDYLSFRGVIIKGKSRLNHELFLQDHDEWYHKMYYYLLREMVRIGEKYNIYLDIKDTNSAEKVEFLQKVLNRSLYDFYDETVRRVQTIRSDEVNILQLTDFFIGSLSYVNRGIVSSEAKLEIIDYLKYCSGLDLEHTTPLRSQKFNIFVWTPRGHGYE